MIGFLLICMKNSVYSSFNCLVLFFSGAPPQITQAPQNVTIVEQSDARFMCEVTGAPIPTVVWKKGTLFFHENNLS
jgi:hypothetical protein